MRNITKVLARHVFDSSGIPTIEAEVYCKNLSASSIDCSVSFSAI